MKKEKKLSIFVDESGDFGSYTNHCPYYIFSLVFHEQDYSVKELSEQFKKSLIQIGFKKPYFHAGPIYRKEEV